MRCSTKPAAAARSSGITPKKERPARRGAPAGRVPLGTFEGNRGCRNLTTAAQAVGSRGRKKFSSVETGATVVPSASPGPSGGDATEKRWGWDMPKNVCYEVSRKLGK